MELSPVLLQGGWEIGPPQSPGESSKAEQDLFLAQGHNFNAVSEPDLDEPGGVMSPLPGLGGDDSGASPVVAQDKNYLNDPNVPFPYCPSSTWTTFADEEATGKTKMEALNNLKEQLGNVCEEEGHTLRAVYGLLTGCNGTCWSNELSCNVHSRQLSGTSSVTTNHQEELTKQQLICAQLELVIEKLNHDLKYERDPIKIDELQLKLRRVWKELRDCRFKVQSANPAPKIYIARSAGEYQCSCSCDDVTIG